MTDFIIRRGENFRQITVRGAETIEAMNSSRHFTEAVIGAIASITREEGGGGEDFVIQRIVEEGEGVEEEVPMAEDEGFEGKRLVVVDINALHEDIINAIVKGAEIGGGNKGADKDRTSNCVTIYMRLPLSEIEPDAEASCTLCTRGESMKITPVGSTFVGQKFSATLDKAVDISFLTAGAKKRVSQKDNTITLWGYIDEKMKAAILEAANQEKAAQLKKDIEKHNKEYSKVESDDSLRTAMQNLQDKYRNIRLEKLADERTKEAASALPERAQPESFRVVIKTSKGEIKMTLEEACPDIAKRRPDFFQRNKDALDSILKRAEGMRGARLR